MSRIRNMISPKLDADKSRELTWHTQRINCVAYSPGNFQKNIATMMGIVTEYGRSFATGSFDKTLALWDAVTGQCQGVFDCKEPVTSVAFSPDAQSIATASASFGSVRLWNSTTRECRLELKVVEVNCVAFAPDGKSIATASHDGALRLWDVVTGACRELVKPSELAKPHQQNQLYTCAFSPDGLTIAAAGSDARARIYDVATGDCLHVLIGHNEGIECCAFSPDGRSLVTAGGDQLVNVWDVATGKAQAMFSGHTSTIKCCAFSPDSQSIVTGSNWDVADGCGDIELSVPELRIWNAVTGECQVMASEQDITCCAFSPDSRSIVSASSGKTPGLRLWDLGAEYANSPHVVDARLMDSASPMFALLQECADKLPNGNLRDSVCEHIQWVSGDATLFDCDDSDSPGM